MNTLSGKAKSRAMKKVRNLESLRHVKTHERLMAPVDSTRKDVKR